MEIKGFVRKCVGGFYYVEASDGAVYTCKARGKFRKDRISPCAGDNVKISVDDDGTGSLDEILPRKNFIVRPPLANLDRLIIVSSLRDPSPDTLVIDKTVAIAEMADIEPTVVFTKNDIVETSELGERLKRIYDTAGIPCYIVSSLTGQGVDEIRALLNGKITAFTGNSGVGKSTLLNAIFPEFDLKTGEISQKLGRGRHTTREVELYPIGEGSYAADTPGFSTVDIERYQITDKEQLPFAFREFVPYLGKCQFSTCVHVKEKGCAVLQALKDGKISKSRHDSYVQLYEQIKDIKQWQQKNRSV